MKDFLKNKVTSLRKGVSIAAILRPKYPFSASNRIVTVKALESSISRAAEEMATENRITTA